MRTAGLADEPLTIEQPVTAPSSLVIEEVGDRLLYGEWLVGQTSGSHI